MGIYAVPEKFFFRIHHVRPRFKNDIESVLYYVSKHIVAIGEKERSEFVEELNNAIYKYPGNASRTEKTINNWRTEISALFGFIEHDGVNEKPGRRAIELAENQDLIECFKSFLYNFQYPGAHVKPTAVLEQIEHGVRFKPAQYILKLLKYANRNGGKHVGVTKFEICHCVFNDLRVTRGEESISDTWNRILDNRKNNVEYDTSGDVVRYAGDIIDYMEIANLLISYDGRTYYLNTLENEAILKFIESKEWFSEYDNMINNKHGDLEAVKACSDDWFSYVNRDMSKTDFSTDILTFIARDEEDYQKKRTEILTSRYKKSSEDFSTKDIGDIGEGLVHGHECMRVKLGGREDLIHLIKRIPTALAVGYDISSVELDERKRYIEVKTTISSKPLKFNTVHLTKNEWNTADSVRDRYYVYRLLLSKDETKLFLLQDPVGLYKKDMIKAIPSDGMDISFDSNNVGQFEELLTWV